MKHMYLVEDDGLQRDWIVRVVEKEFAGSVEVRTIATEQEFNDKFEEIANGHPECIVIDVMLQWTDRDIVDEEDAPLASYLLAGFRCRDQIRRDPRIKNVPLLFYTVLDKPDLPEIPEGIDYLRKDENDRRLIQWLRKNLDRRPDQNL